MKPHKVSAARKCYAFFAACVMSLAATLSLSGCGPSAEKAPKKRVLYIPLWLDNSQIAISHHMEELFAKSGVALTTINPEMSVARQVSALQDGMASQRYDLIIWYPLDSRAQLSIAKRIQQTGIPQVIQQQDFGAAKFSTPRMMVDPAKYAENLANLGAQAVKRYFHEPARVVWLMGLPDNPACRLQLEGLKRGIKQIDPRAEVVHTQGVPMSTRSEALNVMTDLLTRGRVNFNMTMGCGDEISLGMLQALESAGRGKAKNKVPLTEVHVLADSTPPALQALWRADSSALFSGLLPIKKEASEMVDLGNRLMGGDLAIDSGEVRVLGAYSLTADCRRGRELIKEQFKGVPGLKIPECTLDYTETWNVPQ